MLETTRPILSEDQLEALTKEELLVNWKQLNIFVDTIEKKLASVESQKSLEIAKLKNIILMKYITSKKQESTNQFQEAPQILHSKPADTQTQHHNHQVLSLVDPAVNAIIVELRKDLEETRKKRDQLQMELDSVKFNPESQMGKRLMAKCRQLLKENEELGKIISSGSVAQLEHDLAYHKQILNEACENEQNINSFLAEMDNEMDAMQAIILELSKERELLVAKTRLLESAKPNIDDKKDDEELME